MPLLSSRRNPPSWRASSGHKEEEGGAEGWEGTSLDTTSWETTDFESTVYHDIVTADIACPVGTALPWDASGYAESGPPAIFFPIVGLSCQPGWSGFYKLKAVRTPASLASGTKHVTSVTINVEVEVWIWNGSTSISRQSDEYKATGACNTSTGNINVTENWVPVAHSAKVYNWSENCGIPPLPVLCSVMAMIGPTKIVNNNTSSVTIEGDCGVRVEKNGHDTGVNPMKKFEITLSSHNHP